MSTTPFLERLHDYFSTVGAVLRNEAQASKIFPNATDNGMSREEVYCKFLRQHVPKKCDIFLGGFLFDQTGNESRQVDIIVTTDTCPQFKLKPDGNKAFACVDGAIACVSSKAMLNQAELVDSLDLFASIPSTQPIDDRVVGMKIFNYDDWPMKIIFAADGIAADTLHGHLDAYYTAHPEVPAGRRPNLIHVAGKYLVVKAEDAELIDQKFWLKKGMFFILGGSPDAQALMRAITQIQMRAMMSTFIAHDYMALGNNLAPLFAPKS